VQALIKAKERAEANIAHSARPRAFRTTAVVILVPPGEVSFGTLNDTASACLIGDVPEGDPPKVDAGRRKSVQ
jgi:hypothetical protein